MFQWTVDYPDKLAPDYHVALAAERVLAHSPRRGNFSLNRWLLTRNIKLLLKRNYLFQQFNLGEPDLFVAEV